MIGVASLRANFALVKFAQLEMVEARIINRLHTIAMGYLSFKVEIKDFGSFPANTIYANFTSKLPIQNMVMTFRTETDKLM